MQGEKMLRLLIIDDEAPARRYLRRLLEARHDVRVEGEAATIGEARQLIQLHNPDAIFLDIGLAHGTGFDLLDELDTMLPVVFVTAHDMYAARAFDIEAVDYLLKPVEPDRLAQTLNRLRPRAGSYVATRTRTGTRLIKAHELTVAQAQGDYVMLHSAVHGNTLMHTTLKRLTAQLPCPPFCAVSRSLIINIEHVSHLTNLSAAQMEVEFDNGVRPLILGRTASLRLRRAMP
ncbi:LytR/AlgR family response regulator transcription factor [Bordetella sp. 2513F-2]